MPGTPPVTPKHGIPRYDPADPADFPAQWNAGVDSLDNSAAQIISGLTSAKPAAGKAGRFYFCTNTHELEYDNGTTWTKIAGEGANEVGHNRSAGSAGSMVRRRGASEQSVELNSTSSTGSTVLEIDNVEVLESTTLGTSGVVWVYYWALFKCSVAGSGRMFIQLDSEKVKHYVGDGPPIDFEAASDISSTNYRPIYTTPDAALGQGGLYVQTDGTAFDTTINDGSYKPRLAGGFIPIIVPAGVYDVSLRMRQQSGGTVSVKQQMLFVKAESFDPPFV